MLYTSIKEPTVPLPLPRAVCLVVHGRGIELDGTTWVPTRNVQRLPLKRGAMRSFYREDIFMDDPEGFVACGETNVQAVVSYLKILQEQGQLPRLVIFAAGRPKYLQQAINEGLAPAHFAEADVMKAIVDREFGVDYPSVALRDNLNTRDDVYNSLRIAQEYDCKDVVFLNTLIAMPRTELFYDEVRDPDMNVEFVVSEAIVMRGMDPAAAAAYEKEIDILLESAAGQRTAHMEFMGMLQLLKGKYTRSGQY